MRARTPSRRSLRGLDWFVFCIADVQTGFGPFVAVYLTTQKWTQVDIGLLLSVAGLVALVGQMPGGALVDAAKSERFVAGVAVVAIAIGRADLRGLADFRGGADRGHHACRRELCAGAGDRRDQPWSCRPRRDRRTAWPQRPLCVHRQRPRRRRHGRLRLFFLSAGGVHRHRVAGGSDAACAAHDCGARDRSGTGAWRRARAQRRGQTRRAFPSCCASAPADLRRLHHAVPSRQRRHAAADGRRADGALERMGHGSDRRLHRRAAARRRRDIAVGRTSGRVVGPPAVCC